MPLYTPGNLLVTQHFKDRWRERFGHKHMSQPEMLRFICDQLNLKLNPDLEIVTERIGKSKKYKLVTIFLKGGDEQLCCDDCAVLSPIQPCEACSNNSRWRIRHA